MRKGKYNKNGNEEQEHDAKMLLMSMPDDLYHEKFDNDTLIQFDRISLTLTHLGHIGGAVVPEYKARVRVVVRLPVLVMDHVCRVYVI